MRTIKTMFLVYEGMNNTLEFIMFMRKYAHTNKLKINQGGLRDRLSLSLVHYGFYSDPFNLDTQTLTLLTKTY